MRNIILVLSITLLKTLSSAQEGTYIEVVAVDTIYLKPVAYDYKITFGAGKEFMGIRIDDENSDMQIDPPVDEIENKLNKSNLSYTRFMDNASFTSGEERYPTIIVHLRNAQELDQMATILQDKNFTTGKVDEIKFESIEKYHQASYQKMYNSAVAQATLLASIAGRSLGPLLHASEVQGMFDNWSGMYSEMMESMPFDMFGAKGIKDQKVERKFAFRFLLK